MRVAEYVHLHEWRMKSVGSPHWRLYGALRSGGYVMDYDRMIPLRTDAVYLIPPETPFTSGCTQSFEKLYLHFILPPLVRPKMRKVWKVGLSDEKQKEVRRCAEVVRDAETFPFQAGARSTALVHWALAELSPLAFDIGSSDDRVDEAVEYLHRAFPRTVPNDDLASEVGMNTNAFIRLFRQTMHETPQSYYTRIRVDQACRMLHEGTESIDEIAEAAGFCDRYHFSRVFKKQRGMGPAAFRKLRDAGVT